MRGLLQQWWRCDEQREAQANGARVPCKHVAEIARGHHEGNRTIRARCSVDVIHDLRENTAPIDGIDGSKAHFGVEARVTEALLDNGLAIVEHAVSHGKTVDVGLEISSHLQLLDPRCFAEGEKHGAGDVCSALHCSDGSRARVT